MRNSFAGLVLLCFLYACSSTHSVDLIVKNARIYTVNNTFDTASVMVIDKGLVRDIGGNNLLARYTSDSILDAKQLTVYPGWIDAHCHFTGYAMDARKLKLFGVPSFDSMISMLTQYAASNNSPWIEGHGWDEHLWPGQRFPCKDTLDRLFSDKPIFLLRVDGHSALVNQAALDMAHLDATTSLHGGELVLDHGRPTGLVIDEAMEAVRKHIPVIQEKEAISAMVATEQECLALGLTGVVETGVNKDVIGWLKKAYREKRLHLRTTMMLNRNPENLSAFLQAKPYRTGQLHIAGFKVYADGSLGSRGASLIDEYADRPDHYGTFMPNADSLEEFLTRLQATSWQCCVHAIGDAANRRVLQLYARILQGKNDRRWRIEHAQVVDPADLHYFREYNIIPSVQPTHATSDMGWAEQRLGKERIKGAYAYNQLLQTNGWLPLGTDFPVEKLNPLYTFYAAVFRTDSVGNPSGGFQPENALSREDALRGMTIWAARSVFEDDRKGSLEKGKFADFVLLDTDLMKADAKEVYHARVLSTYIDGKCVYRATKAGK